MRKVRVALFFVLTLSFLMSAVSAAPQLETANQTVAEPLQVGDRGEHEVLLACFMGDHDATLRPIQANVVVEDPILREPVSPVLGNTER